MARVTIGVSRQGEVFFMLILARKLRADFADKRKPHVRRSNHLHLL